LREGNHFKVWTLGDSDSSEAEIIQRFFDGIEKYTPQIVSWNGGGFDLPMLHYRAMINKVQAARYWDLGEDDKDFKWNNYISRYHMRHLDLMDVLAMFNPRANAPLDEIAQLCGFSGKLGMDGSKVWNAYKNGEIEAIRNYCETDVANTHLVFLRFQLMRGHLTPATYEAEIMLVRETLAGYQRSHWVEFLAAWK
jgi:predicted PolB exonuclease-like 3'-5' exonuclease